MPRPGDAARTALGVAAAVTLGLGCAQSGRPGADSPQPVEPALRYDLDVELDTTDHSLTVVGTLASPEPISRFFLHPALALDALTSEGRTVAIRRSDSAVELDAAVRTLAFRYHGRFPVVGGRDFKSLAYVEPTQVRLTEVTAWYPVIGLAGATSPWPVRPAIARIKLPDLPGLTWATSGRRLSDRTVRVDPPGDLVIVAVDSPVVRLALPTVAPGTLELDILSPHASLLETRLPTLLAVHVDGLGAPRIDTVSVVELRASTSWLSFVSSGLIVFSRAAVESLGHDEARGVALVAHELAHLWFGVTLRAEGPGARWLTESFAEFYAWRALARAQGASAVQTFIARATADSAAHPTPLRSLGFDDELVYTRGALGVRALAAAVGERVLDSTLRRLIADRRPWRVDALFDALDAEGASRPAIQAFRETWGS